jgi:hypothetical protein
MAITTSLDVQERVGDRVGHLESQLWAAHRVAEDEDAVHTPSLAPGRQGRIVLPRPESGAMPNGWIPRPLHRPHRVMVVGRATQTFFAASEEEKDSRFMPRFRQVLDEWEQLGARVVASFCDDVFQVGSNRHPWAWNLIYEMDDLDVGAAMVQAVRETVDGVRLDAYVELELRIGRPFFAREET